ncbi:MAG: glycosyltransferase family 4 protein [Nocardioides sp.]
MTASEPRRPRVLIAAHYYPPHIGGLEVVAREVADGLHRAGHAVEVITSAVGNQASEAVPGRRVENGVAVRRVRAWNGFERFGVPFPVFAPALWWHAWRAVGRADIVQIHDMLYLTSWIIAWCCRLRSVPYVVTQHVALVHHSFALVRWIQLAVHRTAGLLVLRGARRILPINVFIEASTLDLLPKARTTVLRNGLSTRRFRPGDAAERAEIRARFGLPADEVLVFYVGRFVPKKGFDTLLDCADDSYRLVFVGGDRPQHLSEDHRRIFLGSRPAEEVAELYRAADLFVCASVGEGPLTVLEAMYSGTGVLLNDDPAMRTLGVGGDGVRWTPVNSDPAALRTELRALAADPRRLADMGEAAARAAADAFSWDHHVTSLRGVLTEAMAPPADEPRDGSAAPSRVAVLAPHYPPKVGGVEMYAERQALALRDDPDFEPVVITVGDSQRITRTVRSGVPVIGLPRGVTLSHTPLHPAWWWQLPRLLRSERIDIVSAHAPVPGLADAALRRSGSRPLMLTYHSGSLVKGADSPVGKAIDRMLRVYERTALTTGFERATALIGVSPASLATRHGGKLITPGVDVGRFVPGAAPAPGRLLYVGRIERASAWKGLHILLRAFAELRGGLPGAELHLVGDGDGASDLRKLAADLGVTDAVSFLGAVDHDRLPEHYQQAMAVVLPSLTAAESFGMTLIEAMACGRPVIGSAVGGIPFVIRDEIDGLLVEPGEVSALARACRRVLVDPDWAGRLGAAGRTAAEARFSWDRRTHEMLETLREIRKEPPCSTR